MFVFLIQMMYHRLEIVVLNFGKIDQTVWIHEKIMYIAIAYTLLCKFKYSYHKAIFTLICSKYGTFFSLKFTRGDGKKYELSSSTKILGLKNKI